MPRGKPAYSVEEAERIAAGAATPWCSPGYTMGEPAEAFHQCRIASHRSAGIAASMVNQILVESVIGWEELELEVVRDATGARSRFYHRERGSWACTPATATASLRCSTVSKELQAPARYAYGLWMPSA